MFGSGRGRSTSRECPLLQNEPASCSPPLLTFAGLLLSRTGCSGEEEHLTASPACSGCEEIAGRSTTLAWILWSQRKRLERSPTCVPLLQSPFTDYLSPFKQPLPQSAWAFTNSLALERDISFGKTPVTMNTVWEKEAGGLQVWGSKTWRYTGATRSPGDLPGSRQKPSSLGCHVKLELGFLITGYK